jgi:choline dehydrogenase-like flavoprotein
MNSTYDVIIVGSGASGVSAAWPLVNAGLKVLMLDQGKEGPPLWKGEQTFLQRRLNDSEGWHTFIGEDFTGLDCNGNESPKFRVPAHKHVLEGFSEAYRINSQNISPTGSLALGGVTKMWGAGPYNYRGTDLLRFPVDPIEMDASHRAVAARMGINGVGDDDLSPWLGDDLELQTPMPLHENARRVLERYHSRPSISKRYGIRLGRARNAVLSQQFGDRQACTEQSMCFWGCSRGSIYSADQELAELQRHDNFVLKKGSFVTEIKRNKNGYLVHCSDLEGKYPAREFSANKVLLAAGTVASTALALRHLQAFDVDVPLICHPAYAVLFTLPSRIGSSLSTKGFALGQLAYLIEEPQQPEDYVFGVVFAMEGMLTQEIMRHMPLSRPGAARLSKSLIPSLLVVNGYLSGDYSDCSLRLTSEGKLKIAGGYHSGFIARQQKVVARLKGFFRHLGVWAVPYGTKLARLGSDGHFAGTFPMSLDERPMTTNPNGELHDAPGLYLVDGASLPHLSAKHPTFTIMANADRIAKRLVRKIQEE